MEAINPCRCCLLRPPTKDLRVPYIRFGIPEVYLDMLEKCFDIKLTLDGDERWCGICDVCLERLRDARDFKLQVQRSQAELQARLEETAHDNDEKPLVKTEIFEAGETGFQVLPAQNEAAPATAKHVLNENLAIKPELACWVRLERLRDDKASHASPTCRQTFRHEATLAAHARDHAELETETAKKLRGIASSVNTGETYICDTCGKSFKRKSLIIKHVKEHLFATRKTVKTYEMFGRKGRYICKMCNTKWTSKYDLAVHIITHKPFKCQICLKRFKTKSNLNTHLFNHTGQKPVYCDICHKRFRIKSSLMRHKRTHESDKQFRHKITLDDHNNIKNKQFFKCDICDEKFSQKCAFDKHKHILITQWRRGLNVKCVI